MAKTPNYGFYVESNDQTNFKDWREGVAGDGVNSAISQIDAQIAANANCSVTSVVLISPEQWEYNYNLKSNICHISIPNPLKNSRINSIIVLSSEMDRSGRMDARRARLGVIQTSCTESVIEFTLVIDGTLPTVPLQFDVISIGYPDKKIGGNV